MFQISDARALVARREKPDLAPVPARVATPRQPTAAPRKAPPTAAIPPATVAAPAASELQTDAVGLSKQIVEAADLQTAIRDYLDAPSIASGGNSKQGPIKDQGTPPTEREMAIRMSRLRVSAAELGRSDRFDRAADLISAAIISGHCEPWMYEALAVECRFGDNSQRPAALGQLPSSLWIDKAGHSNLQAGDHTGSVKP